MQYYSGGSYGVPDMQQLALAAASHHMFSDGHYQQQQQQLHHQHQHYQQSLQSQDFVEFYHRQAGASLQEQDVQGTHNMLLGLHHHQQFQQKVPSLLDSSSLHLPLSHHISLGGPETASLAPVASKLQASTTSSHDLAPHYKPSVEIEDFVHHGAPADDADDTSLNGSRWPHLETLALLRIKSEMDAIFRDASAITEPEWDEVSRKLHETGCRRSGKECKVKFEEVQKYCKKTKDGKPERQHDKTYRFHTDTEAIYAASQEHEMEAGEIVAMAGGGDSTVMFSTVEASGMRKMEGDTPLQVKKTSPSRDSPSSISCGDAAVEQQMCGRKRKRNSSWRTMRAFFEDLATQLMERQDALHKKFLEAIEKREEERTRREEAYKRQEMARMSREQDLRVREQVLAATRDAALVAFLQKVTGETLHLPEMASRSVAAEAAAAVAGGEAASTPSGEDPSIDCIKDQGGVDANSRRWPKVEVLALIRVRTSLEPRFQEAGPKAQLWEEVSSSMASLGFSRSAKRCKEKWENINKYYRKTKDNVGRKLRPESATKTCPYFHQLELLYERGILASPNGSKFVCKLDGSQTSGELLESSSRDESQHTQEGFGSGNLDHPPGASMSISNVSLPANLQTTSDGRGMVVDMARLPTATCSSTGKAVVFRDGPHEHDMDALSNGAKAELGCLLSPADQINVNCYPPHHFSSSNRSQKGQLPAQEEPMSSCNVSPGMVGISSGSLSHFMREMMEIQQPPLYHESHHNEHISTRMEMQNPSEEQDVETMRMQQQQEPDEEKAGAVTHERSHHHGSATLMAAMHKLAAAGGGGGGGPPSEFDLSLSSPASSCGQV